MFIGNAIGLKTQVSDNMWQWFASSGAIPDGSTFTRSTSGTYFDSTGTIQTASVDVPRFGYKYNSSTASWVIAGILVEPSSTNLQLHSNELSNSTYWGLAYASITSGHNGPLGTGTAYLLSSSNASVAGRIFSKNSISVSPSTIYTVYVFVKPVTAILVQLQFRNEADTHIPRVQFDLANRTIISEQDSAFNSFVTNVGNGWCMIGFSCTTTSTAVSMYTQLVTYDYLKKFYLSAFQVTQGNIQTSHIPTTTSSVTRTSDNLTLSMPYPSNDITFTFDDDSTQTVSSVTTPTYLVPTTLNRRWIKKIKIVKTL